MFMHTISPQVGGLCKLHSGPKHLRRTLAIDSTFKWPLRNTTTTKHMFSDLMTEDRRHTRTFTIQDDHVPLI